MSQLFTRAELLVSKSKHDRARSISTMTCHEFLSVKFSLEDAFEKLDLQHRGSGKTSLCARSAPFLPA